MDRRQQKTRSAIFQAFSRLLEKKHYNNITVQEILDEANIGRSTFYSHFETKDALLKEMCTDIFHHVFSRELKSEASHDFSASNPGLYERITHLLYHVRENKSNLLGVLSSESGELFLRFFKDYLAVMFREYPSLLKPGVPEDLAMNHVVGSFAEAVQWWIDQKMKMPPDELAAYYLKLVMANPE